MKQLIKKFIRRKGFDIVRHIETSSLLSHHAVDLVVDVGANDGGYASGLREEGWHGPIVSIEPQPHAFEKLSRRFSKDSQWQGRCMGLGSKRETLSMNIGDMDVLSSFLAPLKDSSSNQCIDVEVYPMDQVLDEIRGEHSRIFVKLDTQGFEENIIKGCSKSMDMIIGWQIEMSVKAIYQDQPPMEDIIKLMRSSGYELWRILPGLRDPKTLQAFELDGIFYRADLQ